VRLVGEGIWGLSGLLRPDEVADRTGVELPEDEDYETVAGLIVFELGRVPGQGDSVTVRARDDQARPLEADLTVLTMDQLRVDRVRLEVRPVEDEDEDDS
jgi:CBS domain containing-hemolysin-like protein